MTVTEPQSAPIARLQGWVNTFYRHYHGKKLGPYYVRRWKVGRKVFREYIKPEDVERVKAECQANRERQRAKRAGAKRVNTFIDNFDFLGQMCLRYDKGKVVTPQMEAYAWRIHREGMYVTGRPQMRRKVKRALAQIAGQTYIVKTVFELDGTTKVFMVPFSLNLVLRQIMNPIQYIADTLVHAFDDAHAEEGPQIGEGDKANHWFQPAFPQNTV